MSSVVAGASPKRRGRDRTGASPEDETARVKVETDVDIKDYAETTMNELLGWYGYDKLDTRGLNLKTLHQPQHFPTSSSSSSPLRNDDDFSDDDTGRSRSPFTGESEQISSNAVGGTITCAWCLKPGLKLFTLKTSSGKSKAFCSEPCFNQCRRAAFKKNRVCNWCRHVRHTVNYVDFKDGDDQLQFCSDKCLNQYKMQIFCKETQAYLQMNPHLQEESKKLSGTQDSKLITPDLWMRDCHESLNGGRIPSMSPSDEEVSAVNNGGHQPSNGLEVEDLTLSSKSERSNSSVNKERGTPFDNRRHLDDSPENLEKRSYDTCNLLTSYLREDKDKGIPERKKRYNETEKEFHRKKQKLSSIRHRSNHQTEAPPAHLSSAAQSPLSLQNHNRLFQHSSPTYLPPLSSNSQSLNPPAAHTKPLAPHPAMPNPILPPGLPPPPPLMNKDLLHPPFNPAFFQASMSPQQHLDAVLRMQSGLRPNEHFSPQLLQESMFPLLRNSPTQPYPAPLLQPNTVMLPYPIFVPLPVPIPVPIPIANFLTKDKKKAQTNESASQRVKDSASSDIVRADPVALHRDTTSSKSSTKSDSTNALFCDNASKRDKQQTETSYAVVNNDMHTNRLILTRNKTR